MSTMFTLLLGCLVVATALIMTARWLEAKKRAQQLAELIASSSSETPASVYPRIDLASCVSIGACASVCPEKNVLAMIDGRPRVVLPSSCVGHGDCLRACPVQAIELVLGTEQQGVDVPVIDGTFQTSVPGMYAVGEVAGIGLIHNAVAQGVQAVQAIASARQTHTCDVDIVVVGSGPAGIGAATAAKAAGLTCIVFEQNTLGGTIAAYPRGKVVMSGDMNVPGYGRVKTARPTKEALLALFEQIVAKTGIEIRYQTTVEGISRLAVGFAVSAGGSTVTARYVVLAIGRRGTPRRFGVTGDQLPHVTTGLLDPATYKKQHVVVVGGGDSAIEAAMALAQAGAWVTLVHRSDSFARAKADNRNMIERAERLGFVTVMRNTKVAQISTTEVMVTVDQQPQAVRADVVITCLGADLPTKWLLAQGVGIRTLRGEPLVSLKIASPQPTL